MRFKKIILWTYLSFVLFSILIIPFGIVANAEQSNEYPDLIHIESNDTYYADSYFKKASTIYNPHLASLTMVMANSTGPSGEPEDKNDTKWFENQFSRFKDFFDTISFVNFDYNDDYKSLCDFDTIGVGAAKKEIGDDYTIVGIAPRSAGYYREWANNIFLGTGANSDYMHEGWYNAANKLISFLDSYVTKYVKTSKIKLWITGFSRGGATANIAAGLLDNKINNNEKIFTSNVTLAHDDIFAYTYEAPQGANVNSKKIKSPHDAIYNNIFNIINPNDLVPKVAMSQFGFTRFGIDKYIETEFYAKERFENNSKTFTTLLSKLTKEELYPDSFRMYGLPIDFVAKGLTDLIMGGDFTVLQPDYTKKNYDANIAEMLLLEEVCKNIGSRDNYANKLQPALKQALLTIMDYNYKFDTEKITSSLPGLISGFIFGGIYYGLTGSYSAVEKVVDVIDSGIEIPNKTFKEALKALIPLFSTLVKTYWEKPNEIISIAKYIKNVFDNHNTEVTLSRIQAQDSFYIKAYNDANPDRKIDLIPFIDNANYGRMVFNGFNDIGLYVGNTRKINIDGHVFGKSDVHDCPYGYAAGYYSYATEEKLELFFPLNTKYRITMKDYSKKPYHTFEYNAYEQYFTLKNNGDTKRRIDHFDDWTCFNSKRYSRNVNF